MAQDDLDKVLLGKVAGSLDEQGHALKTLQEKQGDHGSLLSNAEARITSAHARIKDIDHTVNGNARDNGLKTDVVLMDQRLDTMEKQIEDCLVVKQKAHTSESSVRALLNWKESLSNKEIEDLKAERKDSKAEKKDSRSLRASVALALVAMFLSLASMATNCGPQAVKAWTPTVVPAGK